jgi:hypothetical protein
LAAFRAWPIAEPGRSSGRCGPRLQTRFRPASSPAVLRDGPSAPAGSFFESLDGPLVLSWMTGPRTDVGEAEFLEQLSDIARMKVDAEPLGDDALEVEPTPAHDPVLQPTRIPFRLMKNSGPKLTFHRALSFLKNEPIP